VVVESDYGPKLNYLSNYCDYQFEKYQGFFHKTKLLNIGYKMCNTSVVACSDSDVILPLPNYSESYNMVQTGDYDVVIPYSGAMGVVEVPMDIKEHFCTSLDIETFKKEKLKPRFNNEYENVGGFCVFDKDKFASIGFENPHFKSWGGEDDERYYRIKKFGLRIGRIESTMYHLFHRRGKDSSKENPFLQDNIKELNYIKNLSLEEITEYIKTWNYC
jgi:hypothetical protein